MAFAAVLGLAVAANLLIEREISVIRTTRVEKIAVPSPRVFATAATRTATPPPPPPPAPFEAPGAKSLMASMEHYAGAVRSRLGIHTQDTEGQLAAATRELEREIAASSHHEKLLPRLAAFRSHANELVLAADRRQVVLEEFWDRFDTLDARTKASLATSWKIFGRVVARKTLVDLNSKLDEIRRGLARLPHAALFDRGALEGVERSETALDDSLAANQGALTHSQGESWVSDTRTDVAQIKLLQDRLVNMDIQRRDAEAAFLKELLSIEAAATAVKAVTRTDTSQPAPQPSTRAMPAAAPGLAEATETTSTSEQKPARFGVIFWVSVGVLLLLCWVLIHTITSVVVPVRRIRAATLKIASGEMGVQVRRGGIRELDELAVSFNRMAEQLAEAKAATRSYQGQLEDRVTLRTRELQHLAEHDPLTQLPNRRQLFAHLTAAIARAAANGRRVGVFFVDLDNFKNINDSLGHAFGDQVLSEIAARLRATTLPAGFAARLGGDEFTIVCDEVNDPTGVAAMGRKLVGAFQTPLAVEGRYLMISISVGAGIFPDHGADAAALLQAADAALFRAKAQGRSQLVVFSPALLEAASAKFTIEQGLRYALERGEFELVFQPEVDAATFTAHSVEALLRWRMPDGRCALPSEFLSIAEESGLIMQISDWVLRTSIQTAAGWHHGAWPQARIAINLSSRHLLDLRFVDRIKGLLREHDLPAHCIEIELTENVLQTGATTIEVLRELHDFGITIALDDFGIGYSSLASLEQLPLTRVKLDRTLIAGIHSSARSAAIARSLVGLCHSIGLGVTAEGIEHPEQLALLARLTPISLQGYLLARPMGAEQILSVMEALPGRMAALLLLEPADAESVQGSQSANLETGSERASA